MRGFFRGRQVAPVMSYRGADWLGRPDRETTEQPEKMLDSLEIKEGQTVVDLGAGNGYFSLRLARRVGPDGKVLAVDIQKEMLEMLRVLAIEAKVENIVRILGKPGDPKLPADKCDLVLLVDVYHEFSYPEHMLAAIRKTLKKDGRVVFVEFRAEDPKVPIKKLHKMSKAQILKEVLPNGFRLVAENDELPWQHVMFFERKEGP